eukprot:EG_transcript_17551
MGGGLRFSNFLNSLDELFLSGVSGAPNGDGGGRLQAFISIWATSDCRIKFPDWSATPSFPSLFDVSLGGLTPFASVQQFPIAKASRTLLKTMKIFLGFLPRWILSSFRLCQIQKRRGSS